jgi:hypothetical protein
VSLLVIAALFFAGCVAPTPSCESGCDAEQVTWPPIDLPPTLRWQRCHGAVGGLHVDRAALAALVPDAFALTEGLGAFGVLRVEAYRCERTSTSNSTHPETALLRFFVRVVPHEASWRSDHVAHYNMALLAVPQVLVPRLAEVGSPALPAQATFQRHGDTALGSHETWTFTSEVLHAEVTLVHGGTPAAYEGHDFHVWNSLGEGFRRIESNRIYRPEGPALQPGLLTLSGPHPLVDLINGARPWVGQAYSMDEAWSAEPRLFA